MHFPSPGVSRLAAFLALLTLALIGTGAIITGSQAAGVEIPSLITVRRHTELALGIGALTVLLVAWLAPANTRIWVRSLAWGAVASFLLDAATAIVQPVPAGLSLLHACLAPVFLATLVAVAAFTSPELMDQRKVLDLSARPSLRLLADAGPPLVILQVALGAAYRHKILGVMPHMAGAMIVALLLLTLCVVLLQNFPEHPTLGPAAIAVMSIVLVQISLGIAALVMRLLDFDTTEGFVYVSSAHVAVGALTLAASGVLAIEIRRCGRRAGSN